VSEYWGQLLWLHPDGPQLDFFTCFGDAAAPAQSNRCQDIFLHLIEHEFSSRLEQLRADWPDAFVGIDLPFRHAGPNAFPWERGGGGDLLPVTDSKRNVVLAIIRSTKGSPSRLDRLPLPRDTRSFSHQRIP
jgi:hypothetical protein